MVKCVGIMAACNVAPNATASSGMIDLLDFAFETSGYSLHYETASTIRLSMQLSKTHFSTERLEIRK